MPGGLNEVVQQVGADASKYLSEYRAALAVTKELNAANKELARTLAEAQGARPGAGGAAAAADIAKMNAEIRAGLSLARDFGAAHAAAASQVAAASAAIRDTTGSVGDLTAGFERARASVAAMAADALRANEQMAAGFDRVRVSSAAGSDQIRAFSTEVGGLKASASDAAAAVDDVSRAVDVLQAKASGAGPSTMSVLGPALAAAMASGGGGGSPWAGTTDAATAALIARNIAQRGGTTSNTGDAAVSAALASLIGGAGGGFLGGGGGGGGIGGGGGGGGGGFGVGRALTDFRAVASWVRNVYPFVHYAMMATNEILATAGPAAIAGGAATLVGWQGGQLAGTRYQSLNAVQESLGPSLGQTAGGFVGLRSNLQAAQNAANPGVWELAGAAINSLSGRTSGFLKMGTNTIAMLDTFGAKVTQAFQGGAGNQLQQIVSQGTGYLKQFGDVAGNIGLTFLHLAPNLPGVGGDLLTTLQGATRGLANLTGIVPGTILGAGLAAEAGARYGPTLVGGAATLLGKLPGGGVAATDAFAGSGLAGALGSIGAPEIAAAAAGAFIFGKLATSKTPAQAITDQALSTIGTDNFSQAIKDVIPAMDTLRGHMADLGSAVATQATVSATLLPMAVGGRFSGSLGGLGTSAGAAGDAGVYASGIDRLAGTFNNVLDAGTKISKMFGTTLPQAFQLADQAQLLTGNAFTKQGTLTSTAITQIQNMQAGYAAMHSTAGVFGANVGAVNTALGLQNTQLSTVNSAWDQFVNNAATGAVNTSAFNAQLQANAPNVKAIASALGGSLSGPNAAAAWALFASPSTTAPGLVQQANTQADWLRLAQTSGAISGAQGAAGTATLAKQLLPYAAQSPMAAALVGTLGTEAGMPGGLSIKQQAQWIDHAAASQKAYNQTVAQGTIGLANVSQQAQHFSDTLQSNVVQALASGSVNLKQVAADSGKLTTALGGKDITGAAGSVAQVMKDITQGGGNAADAVAIVTQRMTGLGKSAADIGRVTSLAQGLLAPSKPATSGTDQLRPGAGIAAQATAFAATMSGGTVHYKAVVDKPSMPSPGSGPTVKYPSTVEHPKNPPPTPGGVVHYPSLVTKPIAPPAPAGGTVVYHSVVIGPGGAPGTATFIGAPGIRAHGQSGFRVPGFGGGDTFPAMLEGGEAVVPKHLVPAVAPFLSANKVPGFAGGGIAGVTVPDVTGLGMPMRIAMQSGFNQMTSGLNTYLGGLMQPYGGGGGSYRQGLPISQAVPVKVVGTSGGTGFSIPGHVPLPPAASKVIDSFEETFKKMKSPWGKLSSDILSEMLAGIKDGKKETAAMAKALVGQVSSEIGSLKGMGSPWAGIAAQIMSGMLDGIKGNKGETAAMAQAMFGQVTKEVNYMRTVAGATNAISQWGSFGGGLATPTTTAQGQNYQYYTDQQTIAGGGTVSVQQNMGDYLQAMKSFQGDIGKLSKGGINKQMLQQIIGAGPLQGDQEAQSILGGGGGVKGANQLWNQINAMSKSLGITAGQDVYGFGAGGAGGKNVKVGANVTGTPAVHALQSAINSLQGKTVTIHVNLVEGSGGGAGTGGKLNKAQAKAALQAVQKSVLQQAKNNRRGGIQLPGYGA